MKQLLFSLALLLSALCANAAEPFRWWYGTESYFDPFGTGVAGTHAAAIYVPNKDYLKGAKLTAINIPVCDASMSDVEIWVRRSLDDEKTLFKQAVSGKFVKDQYFRAELATPYTIDGEMYVGYTLKTKTGLAIGVTGGDAPGSLYFSEDGENFFDFTGKGYGVSAMQLLIDNLNIPDYNVRFDAVASQGTICNETTSIPVTVLSDSKNATTEIEYTVTIGSNVQTKTAKVSIPSGIEKSAAATIEFTAPSEVAPYDAVISITKVNGQPNQYAGQPVTVKCENLLRRVDRRVVMEEFTGTMCPWCPRGIVGMERLSHDFGDKFIGIALHQFQATDPMYLTNYASFGFPDAPKCVLDRQEMMDPYLGKYDINGDIYPYYGIKEEVEAHLQQVPKVDISLKGIWTSASRSQVKATADVEFLGSTGKYSIVYVLLADSVSSTSSSWQQKNAHYEYTVDELGIHADDPLVEYCKGGKYGKQYISIQYNDVALNSSYGATGNQSKALPETFSAGDHATNEYALAMPTKTLLKNALNKDYIYVAALVIDENGYVANAARTKVLTQEEADGIQSATEANGHKPMANGTYNLAGQKVSADYKGIVIRNGKKFVKK